MKISDLNPLPLPNDGTKVLCIDKDHQFKVLNAPEGYAIGDWTLSDMHGWCGKAEQYFKPTGWMYLPVLITQNG